MNKILKISEINDNGKSGYTVETTADTITLLISNYQSCCEQWGYMMSEDDTQKFVGAELYKAELIDYDRVSKPFYDALKALDLSLVNGPADWRYGGAIFINLDTSIGQLQFVVYNEHNGYYGHEVEISINGVNQQIDL